MLADRNRLHHLVHLTGVEDAGEVGIIGGVLQVMDHAVVVVAGAILERRSHRVKQVVHNQVCIAGARAPACARTRSSTHHQCSAAVAKWHAAERLQDCAEHLSSPFLIVSHSLKTAIEPRIDRSIVVAAAPALAQAPIHQCVLGRRAPDLVLLELRG